MDHAILRRQRRKEARAAQGEDYRLHVQPRLTHYIAVQGAVQAWARLAAILLCVAHGLMLVLMAAGSREIADLSLWFIAGLGAAALLVLAAFLNSFFQARRLYGLLGQQLFVGEALSYDTDWPLRFADDPRNRDFKNRREVTLTFVLSLVAGVASAVCFVVGMIRLAAAAS